MRRQILAMAAGILLASAGSADAAVWAWGCQGQLAAPDQTVVFTRFQMVVVDGKRAPIKPQELLGEEALNPLIDNGRVAYNPNNINSGFQDKTITFTRDTEPKSKITLTEQSSRRLSHKFKVVCGRDDITDMFRKVYRYERDNEPPRTLTMQCIEYTLSTRGGRKGCY